MKKNIVFIICYLLTINILLVTLGTLPIDLKDNTTSKQSISCLKETIPSISETNDDWPMRGHGLARTGYSTSSGPETNNVLWQRDIDGFGFDSPIVSDGKIYIGTYGTQRSLLCYDSSNGEKIWEFEDFGVSRSPAIYEDSLYFADTNSPAGFHCLDAKGNEDGSADEIWNYSLTNDFIWSSPLITNGKVYFGASFSGLFCLDAIDGDELWNYKSGDEVLTSPALDNEKIYFGTGSSIDGTGEVVCLDAETGAYIWNYSTGGWVGDFTVDAIVVYNERVYASSNDGNIYCLDADDGQLEWTDSFSGHIAAAYDKLYVSSTDGTIYCLDALRGRQIWISLEGGSSILSPPIVAEEKVYFGSNDGVIYCLDAIGNDDGTTDILWVKGGFGNVYGSPAIADGKVFVHANLMTDSILICFGPNSAPEIPETSTGGISEGNPSEEMDFKVKTIDPDNDNVYYMIDWGDGTFSDWLGPYESELTIEITHTYLSKGIFILKAMAKDSKNEVSDWSEPRTITISDQIIPQNKLHIDTPVYVIEGSDFSVTITSEELVIENALVTFDDNSDYTSSEGIVTFTAENPGTYEITAVKDQFTSADPIKIIVQEEAEDKGIIYGVITSNGSIVEDVIIRVSNEETSWVVYSDPLGSYDLTIPVGFYEIEASKEGYQTKIEIVEVEKNTATDVNFVLEESMESVDEEKGFVEYIVESQIKDDLGAEVDTTKEESHIIFYSSDVGVDVIESNRLSEGDVRVKISGEADTGKYFVFYISGVEDIDDVVLEYDGDKIEKTNDFISFLGSENTENSWILLQTGTEGECVIILYNSHFSEHTITISSIVETVGGPVAFMMYVIFFTVFAVLTGIPMMRLWKKIE